MSGSLHLDRHGCVSDAGLLVLSRAAPGQAPAEITAHLATCTRCQGRYLAFEAAREWPGKRPGLRADPKRMRGLALVLLVALLLFLATFVYMLRTLGS